MNDLILRMGTALAIGLLVGLERGWRERDEPAGARTAGIRTYGIIGLFGAIVAAVSEALSSPAVLYVSFAVFALVFSWFKWREETAEGSFSVTGVVAAMTVFLLGGLAMLGDQAVAAGAGTALAVVLASREFLHAWLKRISWIELRSALLLAAMTLIVLPVLPDRALDPWGGLNPGEIWLFTVLVASISYAGYIAVRIFGGTRGLLFATLAGAVVSSTAMTLSLGRRAADAERPSALAGAACLAALVSLLRVFGVLAIVNMTLLAQVAVPLGAAAVVFAVAGATLFLTRRTAIDIKHDHTNPFDLVPLMIFALTFAAVALASAYVKTRLGGSGIVAVSTVSSVLDVDAAVLSVARFAGHELSVSTAGQAIVGAFCGNAVMRTVIGFSAGTPGFAFPYMAASLTAVAVAVAAILV